MPHSPEEVVAPVAFAREVISRCVSLGIDEFVFCAGARDAPLAIALAEYEGDLRVWTHFDERSAAFFALGRIMAIARPVAVITTSGTAAAELLPACIEAHFQGRPLLLITADRPEAFTQSGAPQAIDQRDLFAPYAFPRLDLSGPAPLFGDWTAEGPMHLNLRFSEALGEGIEVEPMPHEAESFATRPQPGVAELAHFLHDNPWRGFAVLVGGLEPEDRETVYHFLQDLGAPVVADATSGLREALGNLLLVDGDRLLKERRPGKILRLGEVPTGRFWRDLEALPDIEVLSISPAPYPGLARPSQFIHSPVGPALESLGEATAIGDPTGLFDQRDSRSNRLDELFEAFPDSEAGMIRALSLYATLGDLVYLGNSLPIREWNLAAQREHPYALVRANRGANGIDGQIASFLGNAADGGTAWAVLGDLTTLYDLNALAIESQIDDGQRVLVVVNNGGGRIFDRLPALQEQGDTTKGWIRQEVEADFEALAATWKCHYRLAKYADDLEFEPEEGLTLLEVRPSSKQTEAFWSAYDRLSS